MWLITKLAIVVMALVIVWSIWMDRRRNRNG